MRTRGPDRLPTLLALAAGLAAVAACGGRDSGLVRFDPDPSPGGDFLHDVEYQASCRSAAECVVSFGIPGRSDREIFGSQWVHRFRAPTGQGLYLGVSVRQRCTGSYSLGYRRCDRATGSARVAIYVDGEQVASDVAFHRRRGVFHDYSFGVSVRHRIVPDSAAADADSARAEGDTASRGAP